jgi:hypothetical protein
MAVVLVMAGCNPSNSSITTVQATQAVQAVVNSIQAANGTSLPPGIAVSSVVYTPPPPWTAAAVNESMLITYSGYYDTFTGYTITGGFLNASLNFPAQTGSAPPTGFPTAGSTAWTTKITLSGGPVATEQWSVTYSSSTPAFTGFIMCASGFDYQSFGASTLSIQQPPAP